MHPSGQHVRPLPEPRDHPERVHLPTSEPRVGRLALETERGTFELSAALVAHLVRGGAGSGTVAMTHGATYLSAAASIRAHASLVPMTVAPLAYVPPERPAAPTGKAGAGSRFGAIPEPPAAPVESAEPARIDPASVPPPPEPAPPPPEPAPPRLAPAPSKLPTQHRRVTSRPLRLPRRPHHPLHRPRPEPLCINRHLNRRAF